MVYHLSIEGGFNFRDLGGYPTIDGGITKRGVFVRSGSHEDISPAGQQQIIDYGVKTIIDLRGEAELERSPSVFAGSETVNYLNIPLLKHEFSSSDQWKTAIKDCVHLHEYYTQYLVLCTDSIQQIISTLIESTPTTVFHCYAGKDRTGTIAALILSAVGVPDEVIAEDYALTNAQIAHLIERWREYALENKQDMEKFERDVASEAPTILAILDYIKQQHGDVPKYLQNCGVTSSQLDTLRTRFVTYST